MADRWEVPRDCEMQSSSGTCSSQPGLLKAAAQRGVAETTQLMGGLLALAVSPTFSHASRSSGTALLCTAERNKVWVFPAASSHWGGGMLVWRLLGRVGR